ncbi:LAGLIDADG family homing endonuclease [Salisaeta longa]|uniref:LAGLIDADG family homing endonuclease n=1 Tax=Salisaeta longa TaxID=503170 RepID=UPI0003B7A04C|nr:LAGLIDADG family homing endonuclease [Salisaeta longa]
MSESSATASTGAPALPDADALADGLSIERVFSSEDTHPFDELDWDRRTAAIKNPDGEAIFEQEDVEFPSSWSQLATNVVASKYFYGDQDAGNGSPADGQREYSVKQLVERVTRTIADWGRAQDYFATEEDAETFYEELTWLCVNQYGAFNSPVWFNVGLGQQYGIRDTGDKKIYGWDDEAQAIVQVDPYEHPQASACFIVDVEDSIDGIWRTMAESARLFKFGSGVGGDWSTLRSSKEKLSGGGVPSGPVSFMKVQDATGGTIKSGGKTRRAAIMQTLKCWHPDVEAFVKAKQEEEKKAWALIEQGYDGSFNGPAYGAVDFQNVNQSLRVTDAFMEAAETGDTYPLRAVLDGEVIDEVDAAALLEQVAEGTYICGDPGLQYEDTIQQWHTCPNTDKINSSNPCVTGDTLVATAHGLRRIDSLLGETPRIVGLDGKLHRATRVIETGTKPVYRLRTKSGYTIKLTADHPVWTENRGDVPAAELTKDDTVRLMQPRFGTDALAADTAEYVGLMLGDGCISGTVATLAMDKDQETLVAEKAAAVVNRFQRQRGTVAVTERDTSAAVATSAASVRELLDRYVVLDEGSSAKRLKDTAFALDRESMAALLRGLFTADGTVVDNADKSQYVGLDSTSETLLEQVQTLLLGFGIKGKLYRNRRLTSRALMPDGKGGLKEYDVKQLHSLRITRSSRVRFAEEIGFMAESQKSAALQALNERVGTYRDRMTDRVVSMELLGEEPVYDLTEPATDHFVANGVAVHNCSEYMFLDNSACNLASLNLRKYQRADGSVDVERLRAAARIFITAQEILVDNAGYPSEAIARNSHAFRPLGLGFANLGALLMSMGYPYDSDEGRAVAGAVQAINHCEAYARSAEIAANKAIGPFDGYAENEEPFLDVMRQHQAAVEDIDRGLCPDELLSGARESAARMVALGERHGYRNAQATVIAPTGTIGFYMDCDTTGIEPDIALVKYKLLAGEGEGMMKIVNKSVPNALERLGYSDEEIESIIAYIDTNDTIEGAPALKDEHLPVFDCAFKPANGERSIHHMGHIRMMAAVQPFVSGAISKTVNMPEHATVEDIADAYHKGWDLGCKAIAIYRENSKRSQPLSTSEGGNTQSAEKEQAAEPAEASVDPSGDGAPQYAADEAPAIDDEQVVYKPRRKRLPDERPSITHKFSIAGHEGYLTIGLYPETQQPGEIFITIAKQGSTLAGMMDAFATSISIALQYGVPLADLCRKFSHMRFEPSGFTQNDQIPIAKSMMDYIFRYLSLKFLDADPQDAEATPDPSRAAAEETTSRSGHTASPADDLGTLDAPTAPIDDALIGQTVNAFMDATVDNASQADAVKDDVAATFQNASDAPPCPECGSITVRNGSCHMCPNCGSTTGCG